MRVKALILVGFAALAAACDITNVEGVPSAADVRARHQVAAFIVGSGQIEGLYDNVDVDAVVFSYDVALPPADFWRIIRQRAAAEGWKEAAESPRHATFERFSPPQGTLGISGSEEVRIACNGRRVLVAWVQTDHMGTPRRVRDSSEGAYARERIWPHFERHLRRGPG